MYSVVNANVQKIELKNVTIEIVKIMETAQKCEVDSDAPLEEFKEQMRLDLMKVWRDYRKTVALLGNFKARVCMTIDQQKNLEMHAENLYETHCLGNYLREIHFLYCCAKCFRKHEPSEICDIKND